MKYCPNFSGLAMAQTEDRKLLAVLRCKRWQCEYCSQVNASIWKAILINSVVERMKEFPDEKWSFLTITVPSHIHNIENENRRVIASVECVKRNWDALMKRLKRWIGKFEYVRVLEQHKSGVFHIHLLMTATIPDVEIRKNWNEKEQKWKAYHYSPILRVHLEECNFGYVHDAQPLVRMGENDVESGIAVAMYAVKYISKDLEKLDKTLSEMRVRKIQTSQLFKRKKTEKEIENWLFRGSSIRLEEFLNDARNEIEWVLVNDGSVMSGDYFGDKTDIFPPLRGVDENEL